MFCPEAAPQRWRLVVFFAMESAENRIGSFILDPWVERVVFLCNLGGALERQGRVADTLDGSQ